MKTPRKYFSNGNISRFFFAFAAIMLLAACRSTAQELSGVMTFLQAIASEITRPIGAAISFLAAIAVGLGCSFAQTRGVPTAGNEVRHGFERAPNKLGRSVFL